MSDPVTIGGVTWTPRAFSAAEHQRYAELAAENRLDELAAEQQSRIGGGGSTREKLLTADIKARQEELAAYLDKGAPKPGLSIEQRTAGYALATEIDDLTDRLERVKSERIARDLVLQERHLQAVEKTMLEFMHYVLTRDGTPPALPEWLVTVTDDDLRTIEKLVGAGKLPTGLSALTRRHNAIYHEARQLLTVAGSGSDSASTPQPPVSPDTSGKRSRSKASSSPSKPSNSRRTSTPARSLKQP